MTDEKPEVLLARHDERLKNLEDRSRLQIYLLVLAFIALASLVWEKFTQVLFQ